MYKWVHIDSVQIGYIKLRLTSKCAVEWFLSLLQLHDLYVEFTSASTSVLFELLVIAQQSHWGRSETSFFNVCWLMNILEGLNTTVSVLLTHKLTQRGTMTDQCFVAISVKSVQMQGIFLRQYLTNNSRFLIKYGAKWIHAGFMYDVMHNTRS